MTLAEKHRPKQWSEVVGQDKAVRTLLGMRDRFGLSGRCYWITGQSGTGKTTIARLIAAECAGPLTTEEIDAGELTPAAVREWRARAEWRPLGSIGHALIVNESHGLSKAAIRALDVATEPLPDHAVVIFTTTNEGEESLFEAAFDAPPLLSRCTQIPLARRDLAQAFAARAREIATAEGLNGQPESVYLRLAKDCRNNLRMMLSQIEAGELMA